MKKSLPHVSLSISTLKSGNVVVRKSVTCGNKTTTSTTVKSSK